MENASLTSYLPLTDTFLGNFVCFFWKKTSYKYMYAKYHGHNATQSPSSMNKRTASNVSCHACPFLKIIWPWQVTINVKVTSVTIRSSKAYNKRSSSWSFTKCFVFLFCDVIFYQPMFHLVDSVGARDVKHLRVNAMFLRTQEIGGQIST